VIPSTSLAKQNKRKDMSAKTRTLLDSLSLIRGKTKETTTKETKTKTETKTKRNTEQGMSYLFCRLA